MSQHITQNINILVPGSGEEHRFLCECLDRIKDNQTNPSECNDALRCIANILNRCFDMEVSTTILDTVSDQDFFGINIYPDHKATRAIVDIACGDFTGTTISVSGGNFERPTDAIMHCWQQNTEWHIDFDAKLFYDISHRFTPREIVALLISRIEQIVFSCKIPLMVFRAMKHILLNSDYRTRTISSATLCRNFYMIPFVQSCGFVNYPSTLSDDSLLRLIPPLEKDYMAALTKLTTYYTSSIIDRPSHELQKSLSYILHWIIESVNDLKYHMGYLKKSLEEQIVAEKSFYVKNLLISILKQFSVYHAEQITTEAWKPKPTKESIAMEEAMLTDSIQKTLEAAVDLAETKLLDKLGRCKRISQEEIDILRIEIAKIETVDDKMYYMEKVYDKLTVVNYALAIIGDKSFKGRVRDTKEKLERQKEDLMKIREMILAKPIGQERYGLFIKYPAGYEG